jgi:glycosyltransferase involved in cell wall biosynthesis
MTSNTQTIHEDYTPPHARALMIVALRVGTPCTRISQALSLSSHACAPTADSFFIYGLAGSKGMVHYDTMGLAVAEALASGVIVLAPRIAALPSLYEDLIVWVDPPSGLSELMRNATFMTRDHSGLRSIGMIQNYVAAIKALMANGSHREELRVRGARAARERFSETIVMCKLERWLANRLVQQDRGQRYMVATYIVGESK